MTANISSAFARDVPHAQVFAILYDDQGEICGSGMTNLQNIPANGGRAVFMH